MTSEHGNAVKVMRIELMNNRGSVFIPALIVVMIVCQRLLPEMLQLLSLVPAVFLLIIAALMIKYNVSNKGGQFSSFLVSSGFSRNDLYNSSALVILCLIPLFFVIALCLAYPGHDTVFAVQAAVTATSNITSCAMVVLALSYCINRMRSVAAIAVAAVLMMVPIGFMAYQMFIGGHNMWEYAACSAICAVAFSTLFYLCGKRIISKADF